jgi:hypothetical protein
LSRCCIIGVAIDSTGDWLVMILGKILRIELSTGIDTKLKQQINSNIFFNMNFLVRKKLKNN